MMIIVALILGKEADYKQHHPMKISKTKYYRLIKILSIIFLGLILRLISLNQSFWLDEAITAKVANFSLPEIFTFLKGDFNPPLYYLIIKFWANILAIQKFP